MHLCVPCQDSRDWPTDPVVRTKIELNLQAREDLRARCATCRTYIRNPLFRTCERCAITARHCQLCSKSTLSPEEQSAAAEREKRDDAFEQALDDFTLVVKRFGLRGQAAEAFIARHDEETAARLRLVHLGHIDGRADRPIWKEVLGQDVYRSPYCGGCGTHTPATFGKAINCGHFAIGEMMAWCLLCAVRNQRCATCGATTK
jgi:hypothetical protein